MSPSIIISPRGTTILISNFIDYFAYFMLNVNGIIHYVLLHIKIVLLRITL